MHGTNHVKVTTGPGNKAPNDKKIFVEGKTIGIRDVLEIVQQIAMNERVINYEKIARTGRFFFQEAINEAIEGKDIEDICRRKMIPERKPG